MKIRIKGNSVRLRLTKPEVETFCEKGRYEETTVFANKRLTYALVAKPDIEELEANFEGDTITVYMPHRFLTSWAQSDRVGYANAVDWNNHQALSVLVEKDFTCLDNTLEDQTDNYPNPKGTTKDD